MPASKPRIFEGFTQCTALRQGGQHGRSSEADHPRAAGPLRRGAVPLPRHLDGGLECHPVARRRSADPAAYACKAKRGMSGWRPGDRRADTASMLRVDQAGEYGATRIYAGQLAVLRPQLRRSQADLAHGGAGAAPPRPLQPADGRTAGAPDRAPAAVERRRLRARRRDRADVGEGGARLHRRGGDGNRPPLRQPARRSSATTIPSLRADIAEFRAEELEHRDTAREAGATNAVGYPLLTAAIRAGCKVAIALSKRI